MSKIIGTTTCTLLQASKFNTMNDKETLFSNHRKEVKNKLQSRNYSWCKIRRVVSNTIQW